MTNKISLSAQDILTAANVTHDGSPVRQHIIEHYEDVEYGTVDGFVSDLQSSSWQHGSFGLIYNNEIENIMNNGEFRADAYEYYNQYAECLDSPIADLCDQTLLAIALDMAAHEIASQIECSSLEVVVEHQDVDDDDPTVHYTTDDADGLCDEIISSRMLFIVSHSKHQLSEQELVNLEANESELVYVL